MALRIKASLFHRRKTQAAFTAKNIEI